MAELYQRDDSPYWWCWGYDAKGERWLASTKQKTRRAAEKVARAIERERLEEHAAAIAPISVRDALEQHKRRRRVRVATLEKLKQKRAHLERVLGEGTNVHTLTAAAMERYVDHRRKEPVHRVEIAFVDGRHQRTNREQGTSDQTIAMEVDTLLAALRRLRRHDLYAGDVASIRPDVLAEATYQPRDRWLPVEEYHALLAQLTEHRRKYVTAYCYTGVRFSELYQSVRIGDALHVTQTKGNARVGETKVRVVPLCDTARVLFDAEPLPWVPWAVGRMGDDLKRACARAGIARVSANDLRRTFASWLANAGVPELTTARLMGHASSAMVRRVYAQLAPQTLEDAVARLPREEE
jgi:integrase